MIESAVTTKGQTTLPRRVREELGLQPGDRIRYILSDGEVRLLKARSVMELEGMLARPNQPVVTLEEMERGIERGALEGSR
jgi:antitoxin PrlF